MKETNNLFAQNRYTKHLLENSNMFTKKIIKYGNSHCLIIPVELMAGLGWQRADTVLFIVEDKDKITLRHVSDAKLIKLLEEQDNIIEA